VTGYQRFWRCEHHPVAIDNFSEGTHICEWGCDLTKLEWHHNGTRQELFAPQKKYVPYIF
jgi:hypothetical protein